MEEAEERWRWEKKKHVVSPAGHRLAALARFLISHPISPVGFVKKKFPTTTTTNVRPDADDVDSYREMGPPPRQNKVRERVIAELRRARQGRPQVRYQHLGAQSRS